MRLKCPTPPKTISLVGVSSSNRPCSAGETILACPVPSYAILGRTITRNIVQVPPTLSTPESVISGPDGLSNSNKSSVADAASPSKSMLLPQRCCRFCTFPCNMKMQVIIAEAAAAALSRTYVRAHNAASRKWMSPGSGRNANADHRAVFARSRLHQPMLAM